MKPFLFSRSPLLLPIYAFDISDLSYKYFHGKQTRRGTMVANFGEGDIEPGVIVNGEIKKPDLLTILLREIFAKQTIRFVALSLPDEKGFLRSIHIPTANIKQEELGQALTWQLEEHIPLPPQDAAFDYRVLAEKDGYYDVALRVFPRALIDMYCNVVNNAGAIPVLVEPELNAVVRAIVPATTKEAGMILDWGKTRSSFAIFDKGTVLFSSTVPIGGAMLNDAIAKELAISLDEAVVVKETKARIPQENEHVEGDHVLEAIIPIITTMKEEIAQYMEYWQTHRTINVDPRRLYLSGGDVHVPGFADYLSRELGIEVLVSDAWTNIGWPPRYIPKLSRKDSLRFASSIGLWLGAAEEARYL